jgi:hypothetical protein
MTRAKAVVGVCVVCALAMSAIGVQGASAVIKGTTGFTCKEKKEPGGAGFSNADCTTAVGSGAKFEHVAIPENVKTEGRTTNANLAGEHPSGKLLGAIAGVVVELQATEMVGEATGMNTKNAEGEHYAEGVGKTTFSGITVTKPAGKGCKVPGGKFTTKEVRGTSLGQGMEGKLEPVEGTIFMEVPIEGCSNPSLNNTFPVTGSIKCPGEGAIVTCTHAATTALGTLKFAGNKAGIEATTTATGRANSSEPFTPLAVTTIET